MRKVHFDIESWQLKEPFKINGKVFLETSLLLTTVSENEIIGRGEGVPVFFLGETVESIYDQAVSIKSNIEKGCSRIELLELLPPGGARNSIDCALWDLESKEKGISVFDMLGLKSKEVHTVFTVGIDSPENMAKAALKIESNLIKLKLDNIAPVERVKAVRQARQDATIVIDVNQGWSFEELKLYAPLLASLDIAMLEQPLQRGKDECLKNYKSPIPLCADESCLDSSEIEGVKNRYSMINIKLDKTGGLTEAYNLASKALDLGLEIMVGNFQGTSLGMAPSYMIATMCKYVDLDGPFLLNKDRKNGLVYNGSHVCSPEQKLWG